MKKFGFVIAIAFVIAGFIAWQRYQTIEAMKKITSFDECVSAQYPIRESYPEQCATPDGRVFTKQVATEHAYADSINITSPEPNQKITTPLRIKGTATGSWFFEATFPIRLVDDANNVMAEGFVTADGEWMTESFVPFHGELSFIKPSSAKGKLIINNANPSGLLENAKEVVIPVVF